MRFTVFVKQVPDTTSIVLDGDGNMVRSAMPSILNPYCEQALSRILSMKGEDDHVTVVSMGPQSAAVTLRRCLALGADEAVLLTDRDFAGADTWATSRVLSAYIGKFDDSSDLYVFGRQATDGDTGQVPYGVATILGVEQFAYVDSIVLDGDDIVVQQDYETFRRTAKVPRGSVVSFSDADLNGHIPTMTGYLDSLGSEIRTYGRVDLGLGLYSVGGRGSLTHILSTSTPSHARKGMKVEITNPARGAELIIKELEGSR